ncbi:nitronate monooxygenase [Planosporangium thailandense]|uniref:Propionate 3-nitronate monooxygenase n=1 Tax=Planosporangium thailandense TaxID=765197 RepID=A0ABX0Y6F3_9ACTN|nr:nitronate monooxygenase [Planosporangium thailandense]
MLDGLRRPIIAAPMGGGPSTPALAAAVSDAGGFGFLAGAYLSPQRLADDIAQARRLTDRPFGVNVFAPVRPPADAAAITAYAERLAPLARQWDVALGEPVGGDDAYAEKVDLLLADPVPVVSFAFGVPTAAVVDALHDRGSEVWVTVSHPAATAETEEVGADAVVVQGMEAGAHRGGADDADEYALLPLLRLVAAATRLPMVAAGGIADGPGLAAVLAAGASAAALGTAFLRCPEAGTSAVHRAAVAGSGDTRLTRAFTGRRARGVVNEFMRAHDGAAPAAYPHVHQVTAPLRAAGREAGDPSVLNLWAGQAHALSRELPAAEVVDQLTAEAAATIAALSHRLPAV